MSTIKDIKNIIDQLIKEDPNENKELINFYQKKVAKATAKAFPKAINKAFKN